MSFCVTAAFGIRFSSNYRTAGLTREKNNIKRIHRHNTHSLNSVDVPRRRVNYNKK